MSDASVRLKAIKVALDHLFLDPNNPRFAKSLNLPETVEDKAIPAEQQRVEKLFVNEKDTETASEDDSEVEEGAVRIGDLIRSMKEIGFVPIDQVVVRRLEGSSADYVVIEGNRRVRSAKYLYELKADQGNPEEKKRHKAIQKTLEELDVLELDTKGLSKEQIHDQVGVILGLRHFGQVVEWGPLAKAVNIYQEYMNSQPVLTKFRLDAKRISQVVTRLSQTRSGVLSALKTYIAYGQLQDAFSQSPPKPSHYSLLQTCITNRRLAAARFIEQDANTFELSASSLENLNTACEFENRDNLSDEDKTDPKAVKILTDPKAVSSFSNLVADAASHKDAATKAFAASLQGEVLAKERTLIDAVDNLRSFKADRVWTESLEKLLDKIAEPSTAAANTQTTQLKIGDFHPTGNELLGLEQARKAFKNVRTILDI